MDGSGGGEKWEGVRMGKGKGRGNVNKKGIRKGMERNERTGRRTR